MVGQNIRWLPPCRFGSEFDATVALRAELPELLRLLGAASLLDAPCGDATWILRADLGVRIVGVDIVPDLIAALHERARRGEIEGDYRLADITQDALPRCDAILCRDCLVHLSFANIERAPFSWGAPVELINENCLEAGGGWRDKSLGVWRL